MITVTATINKVVEKIICRDSLNVLVMDKANAIAPLKPLKNIICCKAGVIFVFLPKLRRNDKG